MKLFACVLPVGLQSTKTRKQNFGERSRLVIVQVFHLFWRDSYEGLRVARARDPLSRLLPAQSLPT